MMDKDPSPVAFEGSEPLPRKWPEVKNPTPKEERFIYPGEGLILK